MLSKVRLEVTKGEAAGTSFETSEISRVLIGRQDDCQMVIGEKTVSRYHCLLEINPPSVRLQDFGSLNGTFLNGKKIGQRERDQSWEEAKDQHHEAYELHDGDVLGLGKTCEIRCTIEEKESCAQCGATLPEVKVDDNATILDSGSLPMLYVNDRGQRICADCWKKQQQAQIPEGKKKCSGCGKLFTPSAADNNLCKECLADKAKVLSGVLAMLNIQAKVPPKEKPGEPALLKGYEKVSLLGKGGMGEVWKVRETATGKLFALKTMLPDVAMDDHAKQLFLREAKIGECLRHPNVVKAYATGCANDVLYILMDLCEGGSADDLVQKNGGKLSLEMATWIMLQTLSGLDYVHNMDIDVEIRAGRFAGVKEVSAKGIVHRDLKPGNIFLSDTGDHPTAMVADFGMAKAFSAAGKSQISKTGAVMGTPVFMPRQQARDCKYAKPEVDIWAAAASYYYMLTGKFVKNFRPGVNMWQVLIMEDAVPIRDRNSSVPAALAVVIDRALKEKPKLYYDSAAALRKDIAAALPAGVRNYCKGIL